MHQASKDWGSSCYNGKIIYLSMLQEDYYHTTDGHDSLYTPSVTFSSSFWWIFTSHSLMKGRVSGQQPIHLAHSFICLDDCMDTLKPRWAKWPRRFSWTETPHIFSLVIMVVRTYGSCSPTRTGGLPFAWAYLKDFINFQKVLTVLRILWMSFVERWYFSPEHVQYHLIILRNSVW